MSVAETIELKTRALFNPKHLEVVNESHKHGGNSTESHFKLTIVSEHFNNHSRVMRHQEVYTILEEELVGPIHALALHLFTPEEWVKIAADKPASLNSPDCQGGSVSE